MQVIHIKREKYLYKLFHVSIKKFIFLVGNFVTPNYIATNSLKLYYK